MVKDVGFDGSCYEYLQWGRGAKASLFHLIPAAAYGHTSIQTVGLTHVRKACTNLFVMF